jgi:uncharacterized membrane protein
MQFRAVPIVLVCSAAAAAAEPRFVPVPNYVDYNEAVVAALSDDGRVIVGQGAYMIGAVAQRYGAMRWVDGVPDVPPGTAGGDAQGVSAHGEVIVGGTGALNRWTAETGWQQLGGVAGYGAATDVSADGRVVVGYAPWPGVTNGFQAVRWTAQDGLQSLGRIDGAANAAYAVSADGRVIAGGSTDGGPSFVWTAEDGIRALTGLPEAFTSRALAMSRDGSVIVGSINSANAYRWKDGAVTLLGPGEAVAVTDDGATVFGSLTVHNAFVWTEAGGYRDLADFFTGLGIYPAGWSELVVSDVTPDGAVLAGTGLNPQGHRQAFYAVVPEPAGLLTFSPLAAFLLARRRGPLRR